MTFDDAVEILYRLKTGVIGSRDVRHERPHKPVLLLAVFDGLAVGNARPDHVSWGEWLRARFRIYFEVVRSHNDECSPELPFYYLKSDELWLPVVATSCGELPLSTTPLARDLDTGRVFARFAEGWQMLVANPMYRMGFRDAIVSRFFPHCRPKLAAQFIEPSITAASNRVVIEEDRAGDILQGRSCAFRRRVLEIYDYQCVACGLRIWMPERELSFVDAAHLVPFSETRNDHPTNGLALCKNHHWALDQRLIAPDCSATWRVSRLVDSRRSRGEEELARLAGQELLPPAETAYAPDRSSLEWRFSRLLT